jgi:hypothetical protein
VCHGVAQVEHLTRERDLLAARLADLAESRGWEEEGLMAQQQQILGDAEILTNSSGGDLQQGSGWQGGLGEGPCAGREGQMTTGSPKNVPGEGGGSSSSGSGSNEVAATGGGEDAGAASVRPGPGGAGGQHVAASRGRADGRRRPVRGISGGYESDEEREDEVRGQGRRVGGWG